MQISLAIRNSDDGDLVERISGDFCERDLHIFRRYRQAMNRLRNTPLLKKGIRTIPYIKITPETGLTMESRNYTDAELSAFLHVLRPLILQQEPASFNSVSGILRRRFRSRQFSDFLKQIHKIFDHGEASLYLTMSVGDRRIFARDTLSAWLYSNEYHHDEDKAKVWEQIKNDLKDENAKAVIQAQLGSKVRALLDLEQTVCLVLEKAKDEN